MRSLVWFSLLVASACRATGIDASGAIVDPWAEPAAASVLAFVTTQCPISNQYAPELQRIADQYTARGVRFWLVYSNHLDTPARIAAHRSAYGFTLSALRDPEHRLVHRAAASVTPAVAVFRSDGSLAYSGRIDDRFLAFGSSRRQASRHDLEAALAAVLNGRKVTPERTTPVGCAISD
jgi:hypothetical protein